jgi:hypothetical protein
MMASSGSAGTGDDEKPTFTLSNSYSASSSG